VNPEADEVLNSRNRIAAEEPPAAAADGVTTSAPVSGSHATPASSAWWRIADCGVLGLWIAVVTFTIRYHEKWADEAQAWLLARDLDLKTLWFHELRYEGSPGLWHTILWIAQHVFHASYAAIGPIGLVFATAGVALLIFKAPFPRYIRWPLAFTYFMVYQYAVIARPYTLLPFLAFAAAIFFKDFQHPERLTVVLVLLANLSLHGTILAGCFGLVYLIEAIQSWRTLEERVRNRFVICAGVMVLCFLFVFVILKPTSDVEEFALKEVLAELPPAVQAQQPTTLRKLTSVLSGAFLDWWAPSVLFVVLTGAWCYFRKKFLVFALPTLSLIALYSIIHGYAHHHGTVFIAVITAVWISWPSDDEWKGFALIKRRGMQGIIALLLCLCTLNIWDASVAIDHEYLYPYSGADDAARYLKSVGADRGPIFGLLYGVAGVQAYFDQNIFANMPTAYFHHGIPLKGTTLNVAELSEANPEYIVAFTEQPQLMMEIGLPPVLAQGYEVVHFSDGYMLYKRSVYVRQVYFILRRTRSVAGP